MLLEISIKNFIIIEQQNIGFSNGLNVLTGETGSGKSLIIDALNAIAGGKLSKEDIRSGESKAVIEALFSIDQNNRVLKQLEDYGVDSEDDNTMLVMREINLSGKSVCRINGQTVTLSMLKSIMQYIFDIVGQNEHQLLFNANKHIDFVDSYGGAELHKLKSEVNHSYKRVKELEGDLERISGNAAERERKLDLLKFQIDDIKNAKLKAKEEEELKNKRTRLIHAEKLFKNMTGVYQQLYEGEHRSSSVIDLIGGCVGSLEDIQVIDPSLNRIKSILENAMYQIEDIKSDMRQYRDDIEFNDSEIDSIEERLDLIGKLKRKYGATTEAVLSYLSKVELQYDELINSEKHALKLEGEIEEQKLLYRQKASELTIFRTKTAKALEKLVEKELLELNMQGARFSISIRTDSTSIGSNGMEKIEFLLSPNPGESEKPLTKIASGGEMSRVMLAIKNALSEAGSLPCVIFDEVDAGIGGITAKMVGLKINRISKLSQTICITHLPQIACYADNHIYIYKDIENNKTFTRVKKLDDKDRVLELSRMLGGSDQGQSSLKHAEELIREAQKA